MTTVTDLPTESALPVPVSHKAVADHRGSPIPTRGMIATRFMEMRKRRGLMIALMVVNIGLPVIFLAIRLIAHQVDPKSYAAAGGYDIFTNLVCGVMFTFGFIVAATLGATAGSSDLTEGMFRHQVVTGRSRLALYLARIPAGLGIVVPMVAAGFTVVCAVCCFAAPTTVNYNGVSMPPNMTLHGMEVWAGDHPKEVICNFNFQGNIVPDENCGGPPGSGPGETFVKGQNGAPTPVRVTKAEIATQAETIAAQNYSGYKTVFLSPSDSLMVRLGLWLELEAAIGFIVGLGLASLIGQRTVTVIVLIVLELIITPLISTHVIPHIINLQRAIVGLGTAHLEPAGLPLPLGFGGGGGGGPGGPNVNSLLVPESHGIAILVIAAWLVGWTALGAWRMMTRDA